MINLKIADFTDMPAVFALRCEVFVGEQNVPRELELDDEDSHAIHVAGSSDGRVVACGRIIINGDDAHIGRVAVKCEYRGKGIGAELMRFIVATCRERGCTKIWLNSQVSAVGFYKTLGFCEVGELFLDAGITHRRMELQPE